MLEIEKSDAYSQFVDWSISLNKQHTTKPCYTASILPLTRRAQLVADFSEVLAECSESDWNGHTSDPIHADSYAAGLKLISSLPDDIASPSVGAVAEGLLTFEWCLNPKRVVWVIPNGYNSLDYAVRRGDEILHGTAPFFGKLPETVLSQIRSLGLK